MRWIDGAFLTHLIPLLTQLISLLTQLIPLLTQLISLLTQLIPLLTQLIIGTETGEPTVFGLLHRGLPRANSREILLGRRIR